MQISPGIINSAGNKEYSVARLSKNNLYDVARLHSEVYNVAIKEDYFVRKYDTFYTGAENIGFIAYNRIHQPVAYYGVIPCFLKFEDKIILAAQSTDTMTHPAHRNKGLFVELANLTFDLCRELKIRLIFGFPNQNAHSVMVTRLGWNEIGKMNRFTVAVSSFPGDKLFRLPVKFPETKLRESILPEKGISNSAITEGYAGIYRSDAYLRYKTFTNTYVVKIKSSLIWIKTGKDLIVGDVRLQDNDADFFNEIKNLAKKLHCSKISFQVSSGLRLNDLFASRYTAVPSFPIIFKDFGSGLPLEKIKFTFSDIDIF